MDNATARHIVSGDGDTVETPIEFTPCDRQIRIAAEHAYITERFGVEEVEWTRAAHFTRPDMISHWIIELDGGEKCSVYFDASVSLEDE